MATLRALNNLFKAAEMQNVGSARLGILPQEAYVRERLSERAARCSMSSSVLTAARTTMMTL
eukprot:52095-Eustigmatos_ZCMA.PRE.1